MIGSSMSSWVMREGSKPVYTPLGVFITAWARDKTIRAAAANHDRFLYADTDSLHLLGTTPPDNLEIHSTRLGAWKIEGTFDRGIFVRAKQYQRRVMVFRTRILRVYPVRGLIRSLG